MGSFAGESENHRRGLPHRTGFSRVHKPSFSSVWFVVAPLEGAGVIGDGEGLGSTVLATTGETWGGDTDTEDEADGRNSEGTEGGGSTGAALSSGASLTLTTSGGGRTTVSSRFVILGDGVVEGSGSEATGGLDELTDGITILEMEGAVVLAGGAEVAGGLAARRGCREAMVVEGVS